jgi:hypothetical protein
VGALARPPAAATRADQPEQRHRLLQTFQLVPAAFLGDKQAGDLPLDARGDQQFRVPGISATATNSTKQACALFRHFAETRDSDVLVQISGLGPTGTTYVDATDNSQH